MNHLYLFLRRVLIVFLVSTFTFVSSFTGNAIAEEDPDVVRPFVDVCTLRRPNGSIVSQPEFQNPPFADADKGPVTLRATQAQFELEGNGKGPETGYQGYLYAAKYVQSVPRHSDKHVTEEYIDYTPPVIEVSPSQERVVGGETIIVDNSLNVNLINDLPVNVQLAGQLPQTKENLESVSQYTNVHYHGFNVSPLLGGDDVLVDVPSNVTPIPPPGETTPPSIPSQGETGLPGGYYPDDNPDAPKYGGPITEYNMNFLIPDVHQSGLFWYHSHAHSMSDNQVRGGLSGGIIIKGNDEYYGQFLPLTGPTPTSEYINLDAQEGEEPKYEANSLTPEIAQQVMLFKDFNNVLDPGNSENCFVLNSQVNPEITIQPGEIQLWRVANIGGDTYMNIALENINNPGWDNTLSVTNLEIEDDVPIEIKIEGHSEPEKGTVSGIILTEEEDIELTSSNTGTITIKANTDIEIDNPIDNPSITNVKIEELKLEQIVINTDGTINGKIKKGKIEATVNGVTLPGKLKINGPEVFFSGSITRDDVMEVGNETPTFTKPWGKSNFYILARDGDVVANPVATDSILLPPAARAEFLVVGGEANDTYYLVSDLDTDLTTNEQPFANAGQSYLLATVKVEDEEEIETYTYKEDESTISVCDVDVEESTHTCTGGKTEGNTDLDFFIKNQKPYKIDDVLPDLDEVANLPYCSDIKDDVNNLLNSLEPERKKKLLKIVRGNPDLLKSLLSIYCVTPANKYQDPLTRKRYFYFNSGNGKNFLKGFETPQTGGGNFTEAFDGNRIDKISHVGDIEEWNLVNEDDFAHVFHIHQLDFLVTKVALSKDHYTENDLPRETYNNYNIQGEGCNDDDDNGNFICSLETQGYRDVINLPPHSTTTVRIPFVNPFITGVFVYHCHILRHEDKGMMNNIKVINPTGFSELDMKTLKAIYEFFTEPHIFPPMPIGPTVK